MPLPSLTTASGCVLAPTGWEAFIGELIDDVGVLGTRTKLYFLWQGLNCTLLIFRVLAATVPSSPAPEMSMGGVVG